MWNSNFLEDLLEYALTKWEEILQFYQSSTNNNNNNTPKKASPTSSTSVKIF